MLDKLTADDFSKHLNDFFEIKSEHGEGDSELNSFHLEIFEVSLLHPDDKEIEKRQPFSVLFKGPAEPVLSQQIYTLKHKEMGELPIFLVPLGPRDSGMVYEAVFT